MFEDDEEERWDAKKEDELVRKLVEMHDSQSGREKEEEYVQTSANSSKKRVREFSDNEFLKQLKERIKGEVRLAVAGKSLFMELKAIALKTIWEIDLYDYACRARKEYPVIWTCVSEIAQTVVDESDDDSDDEDEGKAAMAREYAITQTFFRQCALLKVGAQRCSGLAFINSCASLHDCVHRAGFEKLQNKGDTFSHQRVIQILRKNASNWLSSVCWRLLHMLFCKMEQEKNNSCVLTLAWAYDNVNKSSKKKGVGRSSSNTTTLDWTTAVLFQYETPIVESDEEETPPVGGGSTVYCF